MLVLTKTVIPSAHISESEDDIHSCKVPLSIVAFTCKCVPMFMTR